METEQAIVSPVLFLCPDIPFLLPCAGLSKGLTVCWPPPTQLLPGTLNCTSVQTSGPFLCGTLKLSHQLRSHFPFGVLKQQTLSKKLHCHTIKVRK